MNTPTNKLSVEWVIFPDGRPALAFEKPTWQIYEDMAARLGKTAQQMITASVVGCLGPIVIDNYNNR